MNRSKSADRTGASRWARFVEAFAERLTAVSVSVYLDRKMEKEEEAAEKKPLGRAGRSRWDRFAEVFVERVSAVSVSTYLDRKIEEAERERAERAER